MELDRLKRRIGRVKGQSTSPEQLHLHVHKASLSTQLQDAHLRRKALAKQTVKVQVPPPLSPCILIQARHTCLTWTPFPQIDIIGAMVII